MIALFVSRWFGRPIKHYFITRTRIGERKENVNRRGYNFSSGASLQVMDLDQDGILPALLIHRAAARCFNLRWRCLSDAQQPDLRQQLKGLVGRALKAPIAVVKGGILQVIGATTIKDGALVQNAVDEPTLLQLKNLVAERASFIFCDRHDNADYTAQRRGTGGMCEDRWRNELQID
jgi:hypothetical protein